jgi:cleavage and polyadenylation specificity factor subunit 2
VWCVEQVDEYGVALGEGECMDRARAAMQEVKGRAGGAGGEGAAGAEAAVQRWGYYEAILMTEAEAQKRAGTSALKFVLKESTTQVRWRVKAFNLDGRTDGKNLRAVLSRLSPRRLILVHGSREAVAEMRKYAHKVTEVTAPGERGEAITVSLDTQVYDVALGQGFASLPQKGIGSYSLAYVKAQPSEAQTAEGFGILRAQPTGQRKPLLLFDGDMHLTDAALRRQLREAGVVPEVKVGPEGASLVCDGVVVVRVKDNRVSLEGPLSESYFRVRKVLYSRLVAI